MKGGGFLPSTFASTDQYSWGLNAVISSSR